MIFSNIQKTAKLIMLCCFFLVVKKGSGQETPRTEPFYNVDRDSIQILLLQPLPIQAFSSQTLLHVTPGSIGLIQRTHLKYNDQTSLQNALNTIPGVMMESRGYGGSQRINIRGSFLRSPFAVRNVKIYMNGIPLSSPDGTAPLEVIDAFDVGGMEVIKGPAGSTYGSGTGGVLLVQPEPITSANEVIHNSLIGSFGIKRFATSVGARLSDKTALRISHVFQENEGFRDQEFNRKQNVSLFLRSALNDKHGLYVYGSYFNGHLALPGSLTPAQVADDPTQANAFSIANNASLYRERAFLGASDSWQITPRWKALTSVYGMWTQKYNPYGTAAAYTRNGYKDELSYGSGMRTEVTHTFKTTETHQLRLVMGGEFQYEDFFATEWTNSGGRPGVLKYDYDVQYLSYMAFANLNYSYKNKLFATVGASANKNDHDIRAVGFNGSQLDSSATWNAEFLPRVGISYMIAPFLVPSFSISFGNSNPTVFEQVEIQQFGSATGFAQSTGLTPEHGINYEFALKGGALERYRYEINAYQFELTDAILPFTEARFFQGTNDIEEFTLYSNAGRVMQRGAEVAIYRKWNLNPFNGFYGNDPFESLELWFNGQFTDYRFVEYTLNDVDFKDKRMPGMPVSSASAGMTLFTKNNRVALNIQHQYVDRVPLNNANTDWSNPYHLTNARVDVNFLKMEKRMLDKKLISPGENSYHLRVFIGVNNLLDTQYTSFLQTNMPAQRYFNPAPGINFYTGIVARI